MTHDGPTEVNRKVNEFIYILKAKGWTRGTPESESPNKEVMVRASGKDPCYGITSTWGIAGRNEVRINMNGVYLELNDFNSSTN